MTRKPRVLVGGALVITSCCSIQGSAAISSTLFTELGASAVAGWRQLIGGAILVAVLRPRILGRCGSEWGWITLLGAAMATMNTAFYKSVELLPLGVAATLLYLGAFALACIGFRSGPRLALPAIALIGVALVNRPTSIEEPLGVAAGLVAACALAVYTFSSRQLGKSSGADTLALAVATSAIMLSPLSATAAHEIDARSLLILLASGAVGVAGAFWCDFTALRLVGSSAVSVLFALDPAIAALAGALILGQQLDIPTLTGIVMIVIAGALAASTGARGLARSESSAPTDRHN